MSLFRRSITLEISSQTGIVFCTLFIIWLSILLVRVLGQAAEGLIGADIVLAVSALATINSIPTLLTLSLFLGVITTISRNYREYEMMVWFSSGVSLLEWIRPTLRVALPCALIVAVLSLWAAPWSHQQIAEYRIRFQHRSDLSKVALGQFIESDHGKNVLFIEPSKTSPDDMGQVFARLIDPDWYTTIVANHAKITSNDLGERFIELGAGTRYDSKPNQAEFRTLHFDHYTLKVNTPSKLEEDALLSTVKNQRKARPTIDIIQDPSSKAKGELLWRLSIPIATLLLSILAIPLGAVNPRIGKSGAVILGGLFALIYMNLINLTQSWTIAGKLNYIPALFYLHGSVLALCVYLFWYRIRVKKVKNSDPIQTGT